LDAIAATFIDLAAPIRVISATTEGEREALYRLRYRTMLEEGWGHAEDYPDGMERDKFDDRAVHIVAWDGSDAVGSSRLIFPEPGLILPTEEACGIDVQSRGRVVDGGRMAVSRAFRGSGQRILLGLLGRGFQETRSRGCCLMVSLLTPGMIRLYRHIGMEASTLGPPCRHLGAERRPVLFDMRQVSRGMGRHFGHLLE
jgi:N-acyl-L-homoserine lactone synthetase